MHSSDEILRILDESAQAFVFPMLDNGYVYLAASRLTLFRSATDWAMVFEIFGFSPRAGMPDLMVTTIGSTIRRQKEATDFVSEDAFRQYVASNPNWDIQNYWPVVSDAWIDPEDGERVAAGNPQIVLRDRAVTAPAPAELTRAGIDLSDPPHVQVFEMCRWLADTDRSAILATEAERVGNLPEGLELLAVLDDWQHPDLVDPGCPPSSTDSFRSMAEALAAGDSRLISTDPGNAHWRNWPDGGTL